MSLANKFNIPPALFETIKKMNEGKEEYQAKVKALMAKRGIKSLADLSPEEKKDFFNTLDSMHKAKNEEVELEEVKVGDKVHLGLKQKGGSGMRGTVHKIEGDAVHVNVGKEKFGDRIVKGSMKNITKEEVELEEAYNFPDGDIDAQIARHDKAQRKHLERYVDARVKRTTEKRHPTDPTRIQKVPMGTVFPAKMDPYKNQSDEEKVHIDLFSRHMGMRDALKHYKKSGDKKQLDYFKKEYKRTQDRYAKHPWAGKKINEEVDLDEETQTYMVKFEKNGKVSVKNYEAKSDLDARSKAKVDAKRMGMNVSSVRLKEEVEELDEVSADVAKRVAQARDRSAVANKVTPTQSRRMKMGDKDGDPDMNAGKALKSAMKRGAKDVYKEEVEELDELSKDALLRYSLSAVSDRAANKEVDQMYGGSKQAKLNIKNRTKGIERARKRLRKEEVEELDEVLDTPSKTLGYLAKATVSGLKSGALGTGKFRKRQAGIQTAIRKTKEKIANEEVEQIDEVKVGDKVSFSHSVAAAGGRSVKKTGTVHQIDGDTVHVKVKDKYGVMTHKKKASDLMKEDVEQIEEGMSAAQIKKLRDAYGNIDKIDVSGQPYKNLVAFLDKQNLDTLKMLAGAKIKFISPLAQNRVIRKMNEDIDESIGSTVGGALGQYAGSKMGLEGPGRVHGEVLGRKLEMFAREILKKLTKEEVELTESDFKIGDDVICKDSGMEGEVVKIDEPQTGKYYTVKREDGKMVKYAPDELKAEDEDEEENDDEDMKEEIESIDEVSADVAKSVAQKRDLHFRKGTPTETQKRRMGRGDWRADPSLHADKARQSAEKRGAKDVYDYNKKEEVEFDEASNPQISMKRAGLSVERAKEVMRHQKEIGTIRKKREALRNSYDPSIIEAYKKMKNKKKEVTKDDNQIVKSSDKLSGKQEPIELEPELKEQKS